MDRNEYDIDQLCKQYALPAMQWTKLPPPKQGTTRLFSRRIYLSTMLQTSSREQLLRVMFHEAGHFYTRSFVRDILPFLVLCLLFLWVGLAIGFVSVREAIPTGVPLLMFVFVLLFWFHPSRKKWEQIADRWAEVHWPKDLMDKGVKYW